MCGLLGDLIPFRRDDEGYSASPIVETVSQHFDAALRKDILILLQYALISARINIYFVEHCHAHVTAAVKAMKLVSGPYAYAERVAYT